VGGPRELAHKKEPFLSFSDLAARGGVRGEGVTRGNLKLSGAKDLHGGVDHRVQNGADMSLKGSR